MSDSYHNELINLGYAQGYRDGERKGRADAIDEIENNMSVHQVGLSGYYYISFDEWERLKEQKK